MPEPTVILDPTAPPQRGQATRAWPLDELAGKVVGFVDNAKPNFNHLVDAMEGLLTTEQGVARVVKLRKRAASIPADTAALDALAAECDLVITGSGD